MLSKEKDKLTLSLNEASHSANAYNQESEMLAGELSNHKVRLFYFDRYKFKIYAIK